MFVTKSDNKICEAFFGCLDGLNVTLRRKAMLCNYPQHKQAHPSTTDIFYYSAERR